MKFADWSLERRFAVLSLITLSVLGLLMMAANFWFTRNQLIRAAAIYSEAWVNSIVRHQLVEGDFNDGISNNRYLELKRYFVENVLDSEIKRVKIWNSDGNIIFSDEETIVGRKYPVEEHLRKALQGQVAAGFKSMSGYAENHSEKELARQLLVIYIPIHSSRENNKILGAFELYIDDNVLSDQVTYNFRVTAFSIMGSLLLLYIALIGIVKKASSKISCQSEEIVKLYRNLNKSLEWQEKAQLGTVQALMSTLNAKDDYTAGHSARVADYCLGIGIKMGLPDNQLKLLEEAALFHDIGKIGITEAILNKPGSFTEQEYEIIKRHAAIGAEILGAIHYFNDHKTIIRHHHERVDGRGYPEGLTGDQIPLESKILAVADTFDALTSDRPYRKGMSSQKALAIIKDVQGSQLDTEVIKFFLEFIEEREEKAGLGLTVPEFKVEV